MPKLPSCYVEMDHGVCVFSVQWTHYSTLYTAQDRTRIFTQCDFHTEGKMVVVRSVACRKNISSNKITLRTVRTIHGGALERSVEL